MRNALKSNLSKKLAAFIITAVITAINNRFGFSIDANEMYGLYALTIAYIAGQSHVDAKKALSGAVNASAKAVTDVATSTTGEPIQTLLAPPMTYQEIVPYVNRVNAELTQIYDQLSQGKVTPETQNAINMVMTLHEYLTKAGEAHAEPQTDQPAAS